VSDPTTIIQHLYGYLNTTYQFYGSNLANHLDTIRTKGGYRSIPIYNLNIYAVDKLWLGTYYKGIGRSLIWHKMVWIYLGT